MYDARHGGRGRLARVVPAAVRRGEYVSFKVVALLRVAAVPRNQVGGFGAQTSKGFLGGARAPLDAAEEFPDPVYAWDGEELLFSVLDHVRKPFPSAMLLVDVSFRGKPRRHSRETKGGEYGEDRGDRGRNDVLCKSPINTMSLLRG